MNVHSGHAEDASMRMTKALAPPAADNREAILTAAQIEFGTHGYKGATIKGIAARAGISPALVYWYYRDKEDLFQAVIIRISDQLLSVSGLVSFDPAEEPAAMLTRFVESYQAMFRRPE